MLHPLNYATIINSQKNFFDSDVTKDIAFRKKQLLVMKSLLKNHEKEFYNAIYLDFKKSEFEAAATELVLIYHEINTALNKLRAWSRRKRVSTNIFNFPARSFIIPEPLGVTLVIGAWNYPYQLSLAPAVSALAAGNTVILKPSEICPNTSAVMAKLINENFPSEYFHVIEGGADVTTELLKLKFDKIFFTGSTAVGKIIYEAAAKNLTPVTLELGGKSPAFILKDCNMEISVQRLVWAKFINAGQTCIAPDYIMVEESVETLFLETLKKQIEKYHSGKIDESYVQIINDKHMERLIGLLETSKIFLGGTYDRTLRYFSPTVMNKVSFDDAIMKEEIFGPILPVITFTNLDAAIARVKELDKPLSCYVFSKDDRSVNKVLNLLSFGGGAVNDALMHISNTNLPFGGVGKSGMGSYHAEAGFRAFSHYKSILHKSSWFETNIKYPPYTDWKKKIIRMFMR
jgi:aldehyde dehydrogenase (NAD+)